MGKQAFILRIKPSHIDRVQDALSDNQIIIGWAEAEGLLDENLSWEEFRDIISATYYADEKNLRRAGYAAGVMWKFIRDMTKGDLVVVPDGPDFYVAKISGPTTHDPAKIGEDTAYRRNVDWLNDKKPIPRNSAKSALISRMKTQGTCVHASDLLSEIKECIKVMVTGSKPAFQTDLQSRLIKETLCEILSGRMDDRKFESLIKNVLEGLGACGVRIVPRMQDKGADLVATFRVAGVFEQIVAVQAKYWRPDPPVGQDVVEQLIAGIDAESASLGAIVTSGTIGQDAMNAAEQFFKERGIRIELVDGEQLARLIVEHGVKTS